MNSRLTLLRRAAMWCLLVVALSSNSLLAQTEPSSSAPRITSFRVVPVMVSGERWYAFHWDVVNADRVRLFQDGKEMRGRIQLPDGSVGWPPSMPGALQLELKATTTYELVAEHRAGPPARRTFTVNVARLPSPTRPPAETRACTVAGTVVSEMNFQGVDDVRQRAEIKTVYVLGAQDRKLVARSTLTPGSSSTSRRYMFADLPADRRYVVLLDPAWRTQPAEIAVACPDSLGRFDFTLSPLRHTGNRLGS